MRGKGPSDAIVACVSGITPAYAGKSEASYTEMQEQAGSPPPMRGKGFDADCVGVRPGITPAYAGKRPTEHSVKRYKRDHPRLCGEKQKIFPSSLGDRGSPPPMRGKAFSAD